MTKEEISIKDGTKFIEEISKEISNRVIEIIKTEFSKIICPKFKITDLVKWHDKIVRIDEIYNRDAYFEYDVYTYEGVKHCVKESDLESYN